MVDFVQALWRWTIEQELYAQFALKDDLQALGLIVWAREEIFLEFIACATITILASWLEIVIFTDLTFAIIKLWFSTADIELVFYVKLLLLAL